MCSALLPQGMSRTDDGFRPTSAMLDRNTAGPAIHPRPQLSYKPDNWFHQTARQDPTAEVGLTTARVCANFEVSSRGSLCLLLPLP